MNKYTQVQIELQNEMATLSGCRAQLRDLWLKNSSADLIDAMNSILERLKQAEQELNCAIAAKHLEEDLQSKSKVPVVGLSLKI